MFRSESWEMSDAIIKVAEVTHMGLLWYITGKRARSQAAGEWETTAG